MSLKNSPGRFTAGSAHCPSSLIMMRANVNQTERLS